MSSKTTSQFDASQISDFIREAKSRVGGEKAWAFLGPEIQLMAIEAQAFRVMSGQRCPVEGKDMKALRSALCQKAGLEGW